MRLFLFEKKFKARLNIFWMKDFGKTQVFESVKFAIPIRPSLMQFFLFPKTENVSQG